MFRPLRTGAGRLARVDVLPTPVRAVFGHYAEGGRLESSAIRLQRTVEATVQAIIDDAYDDVEAAIAAEFGRESVEFTYDTKLTLPVELTLGHVYRRATAAAPPGVDPVAGERKTDPVSSYRRRAADGDADSAAKALVRDVRRAEAVAELVVVALLDGDMRDAINDAEYDDFRVDFAVDEDDRERVAELAQDVLEAEVVDLFAQFPAAVREAYDAAVERSEAHQERDPHFRDLMADAVADEPGAKEALREEYRDVEFEERPDLFAAEVDLPYLVTQYGRVGVIYHGMVEMFREAGVSLSPEFERSVVLAIVGAQVWLDDVDDFAADMAEGQLTPVTAEYLLADSDAEAYDRVVAVTHDYLDAAREAAHASDAPITGIAVEYIRHAGNPEKLPR